MAELLLFAADRAQHVEFLIKPALEEGRIVISDRYADATAAYQGAGRGFDQKTVEQVISLATGGLNPDLRCSSTSRSRTPSIEENRGTRSVRRRIGWISKPPNFTTACETLILG